MSRKFNPMFILAGFSRRGCSCCGLPGLPYDGYQWKQRGKFNTALSFKCLCTEGLYLFCYILCYDEENKFSMIRLVHFVKNLPASSIGKMLDCRSLEIHVVHVVIGLDPILPAIF